MEKVILSLKNRWNENTSLRVPSIARLKYIAWHTVCLQLLHWRQLQLTVGSWHSPTHIYIPAAHLDRVVLCANDTYLVSACAPSGFYFTEKWLIHGKRTFLRSASYQAKSKTENLELQTNKLKSRLPLSFGRSAIQNAKISSIVTEHVPLTILFSINKISTELDESHICILLSMWKMVLRQEMKWACVYFITHVLTMCYVIFVWFAEFTYRPYMMYNDLTYPLCTVFKTSILAQNNAIIKSGKPTLVSFFTLFVLGLYEICACNTMKYFVYIVDFGLGICDGGEFLVSP